MLFVVLMPPAITVVVVVPPVLKPMNPLTSQSPAVSEIEVTVLAVAVVSDVAAPVKTMD